MLSTSQQKTILRLLCYPRGTIDPTSMDYSNIITRQLTGIDGEDQEQTELILQWIDQTEDQIDKAVNSAGVKRVDDIEFFGNADGTKTDVLQSQLAKYLKQLSDWLGIPNRCAGCGSMGSICN